MQEYYVGLIEVKVASYVSLAGDVHVAYILCVCAHGPACLGWCSCIVQICVVVYAAW